MKTSKLTPGSIVSVHGMKQKFSLTNIRLDRQLGSSIITLFIHGWHAPHKQAKIKRESRLSYRFKHWFLSLRWINNWRWRKSAEMIQWIYYDKDIKAGGFNCYLYDWINNTGTSIMPDYKTIRRLA